MSALHTVEVRCVELKTCCSRLFTVWAPRWRPSLFIRKGLGLGLLCLAVSCGIATESNRAFSSDSTADQDRADDSFDKALLELAAKCDPAGDRDLIRFIHSLRPGRDAGGC